MTTPSLLQPKLLTTRLWQVVGLLMAGLVTLIVANVLALRDGRGVSPAMLGHDFLAFYSAGTFVNEGRARHLYDLDALRGHQSTVIESAGLEATDLAPWWNPPHVAMLFAPLARLPFEQALLAWTALNVACLVGACALLMRVLGPNASARQRWLVPACVVVTFPTLHFLGHGQNTGLSLFLLSGAARAFTTRRPIVAGALAALLAYKPQHAALLSGVLVALMGPRVLIGLAIAAVPQLAVTLLAMPGALGDFLQRLPTNLRVMQFDRPYPWDRHTTILSFWRQLLQGSAVGPHAWLVTAATAISTAVVAGSLVVAWARSRRADGRVTRTRVLALAMLATPTMMPFYFDYDLLLLAVPATLVAREALAIGAPSRGERWLALALLALALTSIVNVHLERLTGVNATAGLLTTLTVAASWSRRPAIGAIDADREGLLGYEDLQGSAHPRAPRRAA